MGTDKEAIWVVGAGPMAVEYAKTLEALGFDFTVIGRGEKSANEFRAKTGRNVILGGLSAFLDACPDTANFAIVAVSVAELFQSSLALVKKGVKNLLIEKPCALFKEELLELKKNADKHGAKIFVAYNRRFLASVLKARDLIEEDGGLTSFRFDFTELAYRIEILPHPEIVKKRWFLANSTHVADLAFYLGGIPSNLEALCAGHLSWHPSASFFAGFGNTEKNVPFDYRADWNAPGRWSIELFTKENRYVLMPLETLKIQKKGSFNLEDVQIDDSLDKKFKPGLFLQTKNFISGDFSNLQSLEGQIKMMSFYEKMAGY